MTNTPRRWSIVGNSGSGKSTLATAIAEATGAHHVELDAIWHRAGWANPDVATFRAEVAAVLAREYAELLARPEHAAVAVHRLRTRADARTFAPS